MSTESPGLSQPWRGVHQALADPLRIRMFEALWHGPRSARELAADLGLPPDRLYYHLHQLEQAKIIEVGDYRPLPSGRVERLYRRVEAEPPGDFASGEDLAVFLGSVLDATKADITAALMAKEAGQHREVAVGRGPFRLTDQGLAELRRYLADLRHRFGDPGESGTWVPALVAVVDLEDRPPAPPASPAPEPGGASTEDHC